MRPLYIDRKILNMGCGTCVAVCLEGDEKEAEVLNCELKIARRMEGNPIQIGDFNDADMIDWVTQTAPAKAQIVMAMDNTLKAKYATQPAQTRTLQFLATSRDYFENGTADTRVYQWQNRAEFLLDGTGSRPASIFSLYFSPDS